MMTRVARRRSVGSLIGVAVMCGGVAIPRGDVRAARPLESLPYRMILPNQGDVTVNGRLARRRDGRDTAWCLRLVGKSSQSSDDFESFTCGAVPSNRLTADLRLHCATGNAYVYGVVATQAKEVVLQPKRGDAIAAVRFSGPSVRRIGGRFFVLAAREKSLRGQLQLKDRHGATIDRFSIPRIDRSCRRDPSGTAISVID